jgi:hypothetical protein
LLTPLELTNEEMEVLVGLAEPTAWRQKDAFLREVAEALAALLTRGPGVMHRIGRAIQKNYVVEARRETETGSGVPKHSRSPRGEATAGTERHRDLRRGSGRETPASGAPAQLTLGPASNSQSARRSLSLGLGRLSRRE